MDSSSNPDANPVKRQSHSPDYHAMVLRLWREHPDAPWRLMVQEIGDDKRHSFPDLDSLMAHLLRLMAEPLAAQRDSGEPDDADDAELGAVVS